MIDICAVPDSATVANRQSERSHITEMNSAPSTLRGEALGYTIGDGDSHYDSDASEDLESDQSEDEQLHRQHHTTNIARGGPDQARSSTRLPDVPLRLSTACDRTHQYISTIGNSSHPHAHMQHCHANSKVVPDNRTAVTTSSADLSTFANYVKIQPQSSENADERSTTSSNANTVDADGTVWTLTVGLDARPADCVIDPTLQLPDNHSVSVYSLSAVRMQR